MHKWHVNAALGRDRPLRLYSTTVLVSRYFTSIARFTDEGQTNVTSKRLQDRTSELESLYESSQLNNKGPRLPNSLQSTRPLAPSEQTRSAIRQPNIPGALDVRNLAVRPPTSNSSSWSSPQRTRDLPSMSSSPTSVPLGTPSSVNASRPSYRGRREDNSSQFEARVGRDPRVRSGTDSRRRDLEAVHPAVANLSTSEDILDTENTASELSVDDEDDNEDAEALISSGLEDTDDILPTETPHPQSPTASSGFNRSSRTSSNLRSPTFSRTPKKSSHLPSLAQIPDLDLSEHDPSELPEDEIPDPPLPPFEPTAPTLESLSPHSPALALDRFSMSAMITQRMDALTNQSLRDKREVDRLASLWLEGERVLFAGGRAQKEAVVREVERRLRQEGTGGVKMLGEEMEMASEEEKGRVVEGLVGGTYRIGKGEGVVGGVEMLAERNGSFMVEDGERLMKKIKELVGARKGSGLGKKEQSPRA